MELGSLNHYYSDGIDSWPMRRPLGILLVICLTSFVSISAAACDLIPSEVRASLSMEPPAKVVNLLWDRGACESALLRGLGSGEPEWIALAVALRPHTDAWASESLLDSLGEAMQRAPSRLLPLVGGASGFDVRICLPWMMDDSGRSDQRYRQIIRRARTMFASFAGTTLEQPAADCLRQVEIAERGPLFPQPHAP